MDTLNALNMVRELQGMPPKQYTILTYTSRYVVVNTNGQYRMVRALIPTKES